MSVRNDAPADRPDPAGGRESAGGSIPVGGGLIAGAVPVGGGDAAGSVPAGRPDPAGGRESAGGSIPVGGRGPARAVVPVGGGFVAAAPVGGRGPAPAAVPVGGRESAGSVPAEGSASDWPRAGIAAALPPGGRPAPSAGWAARPRSADGLDTIDVAAAQLAAGRPVVVVGEVPGEPGVLVTHLVVSAPRCTPELMAFVVRHTGGVVGVALTDADCRRLDLPPMVPDHPDPAAAAVCVSVDAATGVDTGISAADRTRTAVLLADPAATADDFTRPGHLFPVRAAGGGVLQRAAHPEAVLDLTRLAGTAAAGVFAEVVADDGTRPELVEVRRFARRHRLAVVSIADLVAYRRRHPVLARARARARMPLLAGDFDIIGYVDEFSGRELVALVHGAVGAGTTGTDPVAVHAECLLGDIFGALRCGCRAELDASLRDVVDRGAGVVLYARQPATAPTGALDALIQYQAQDEGTADGTAEHRDAELAAWADDMSGPVLSDLGVRRAGDTAAETLAS